MVPINYWLHTLFSQVDVSLNDTLISPSENTYPYRAYIEATLNYGRDATKSQLTASLFYRDSSHHFNDTQGNDNSGLKVRRELTVRIREVDMMGRLHTDITAQDRYLLNGVNVKIRLIPSKRAFNLMAHGVNPSFVSTSTRASLLVRKCKLNPPVALAHAKALERGTVKYPLKRVVIKTFSIPQNNLSAVQDNLFLSQLPTRIVIGLVDSAAFNGHYSKDSFNFTQIVFPVLVSRRETDSSETPDTGLSKPDVRPLIFQSVYGDRHSEQRRGRLHRVPRLP